MIVSNIDIFDIMFNPSLWLFNFDIYLNTVIEGHIWRTIANTLSNYSVIKNTITFQVSDVRPSISNRLERWQAPNDIY